MPKDNREVLRGLTVVEDGKQKTFTDIDEISAFFTQEELDGFVKREILSGEWKSTKLDGETSNVADAGFLSLEETMKRFEDMDFSDEVVESLRHHKPALAQRFGKGDFASKPPTIGNLSKSGGKSGVSGEAGGGGSDSENASGTVQTKFTEKDLENDSKTDLLTKVDELKKDGFTIEVKDTDTKAVIIGAILSAKKSAE